MPTHAAKNTNSGGNCGEISRKIQERMTIITLFHPEFSPSVDINDTNSNFSGNVKNLGTFLVTTLTSYNIYTAIRFDIYTVTHTKFKQQLITKAFITKLLQQQRLNKCNKLINIHPVNSNIGPLIQNFDSHVW